MTQTMKVIVTGANRGIGLAICNAVLKLSPPLVLHACSRSGDNLGFKYEDSTKSVVYEKLDIADEDSVKALAARIHDSNEKVDVLINNAGTNLDRKASLEIAQTTLDVNFNGTVNMCTSLMPYMRPGGRIVNVSSIASVLKLYEEPIRKRFREAKDMHELDTLEDDYLLAVSQGKEQESGWGVAGRSYNISKALLNSATRILAAENPALKINSCCPGWIATDMGRLVLGGGPSKTPEQGATIPMRLAFGDIGDVTGQFWANSSVNSTDAGQVRKP